MNIEIIDLGINNLFSIERAFNLAIPKSRIQIRNQGENITGTYNPDLIVLPGIGNFGRAIKSLEERKLEPYLNERISENKLVVGICLGMQLIGEGSEESPNVSGLGFIEGISKKLPIEPKERVPNVGWQSLNYKSNSFLDFQSKELDFYFTHSYHFEPKSRTDILSTTSYGKKEFVSSIKKGNIIGFQFHPEKSGQAGIRLIAELRKLIHEN